MPNFRWLFATLDNYFARLLALILPFRRTTAGRVAASKYADVFYGVVTSALALGLFLPMQPETSGLGLPPTDRPAVAEVVERFAPEVRLHPEERYFPSSVSWYLDRTHMRVNAEAQGDLPTTVSAGAPALTKATASKEKTAGDAISRYFLQILNNEHESAARAGNLASAKTYVHLRAPADGSKGLDIQYWFFFPYSGPIIGGPAGGAHEGDWEHITVRLDPTWQRVEKVFYAAHNSEGGWVSAENVRFRDETHPVVYTARYGHASYPTSGLQSRGMLPADRTADGGATWRTWENLRIIADKSGPRDGVDWLAYAGRWGEPGVIFSGPHGPAFQRYWTSEI
jgi:hypothetical protein